jgi:hypothetical protein
MLERLRPVTLAASGTTSSKGERSPDWVRKDIILLYEKIILKNN